MSVTRTCCAPVLAFLLVLFIQTIHAAEQLPIPPLPVAVTNNAVAKVNAGDDVWLISFMGLSEPKTYQQVHNRVWAHKIGDKGWQEMQPVPSSLPLKGRLASIAVTVQDQVYLFGGYTVAKDHSEISSPDNFRFDVLRNNYTAIPPMPVPVDDTAAVVYQQRYIYLISGWHNDGNVNLVQVYDTKKNIWQQASPLPGPAVFGQAAAGSGRMIILCDGVAVKPHSDKRRTFRAQTACYRGEIDNQNPHKIDWRIMRHPTGKGRYRMAATGLVTGAVLFWGGAENPYNYNGIGYNGRPAHPSGQLWQYDVNQALWQVHKLDAATMDHRGLIELDGNFVVLGGMGEQQKVLRQVTRFSLPTTRN